MILEDLAKLDRMQFKKLSYFRLVFYKLYARKTNRSNRNVENTVESGGKLKIGFKKERKNGVSTAIGKIFLKNLFQVFCAKIRCFHKNCAD